MPTVVEAVAWSVTAVVLGLSLRDGVSWWRTRRAALRGDVEPAARLNAGGRGLPLVALLAGALPALEKVVELDRALREVPQFPARIVSHLIRRMELLDSLLDSAKTTLAAACIVAAFAALVAGLRASLGETGKVLVTAREDEPLATKAWAAARAREWRLGLLPVGIGIMCASLWVFADAVAAHQAPWSEGWLETVREGVRTSDARRDALDGGMAAAIGACVVGAVMSVWGAERILTTMRGRALVVYGGLGLAVVGCLVWHTAPRAVEGATPVSSEHTFVNASLSISPPRSLVGVGPDPAEEGPNFHMSGLTFVVDGSEVSSAAELRRRMQYCSEHWEKCTPHLVLSTDVPLSALRARLAMTARANVTRVNIGFTATEERTTPLLGRLVGRRETAASFTIAVSSHRCPAESSRIPLVPFAHPNLAALVDEIVALRREDEQPCLVVGQTICEGLAKSMSSIDEVTAACGRVVDVPTEVRRRVTIQGIGEALRWTMAGASFDAVVVEALDSIQVHDGDGVTLATIGAELEAAGRTPAMLMNGGMFHPGYAPVGLLIAHRKVLQPIETGEGDGNFFLKPNGVFGQWLLEDEWAVVKTSAAVDALFGQATQSGPLVLNDGYLHPKINPTSKDRAIRNGVCIPYEGTVVFLIARTPVTFFEFARAMAAMQCQDGLYLDGSISQASIPALAATASDTLFGPVISISRPRE